MINLKDNLNFDRKNLLVLTFNSSSFTINNMAKHLEYNSLVKRFDISIKKFIFIIKVVTYTAVIDG